MGHSTICGGSTCERYIKCTGSTELIKKAPKRTDVSNTYEGSALHFVMESVLKDDLDPYEFAGREVELDDLDDDGNPVIVEITEKHIVQRIEPAINWFWDEIDPEAFWVEKPVEWGDDLVGMHGTADVIYRQKGEVFGIVDWKFGRSAVTSTYQNRFYLGAAMDSYAWFNPKDWAMFSHIYQSPPEGAPQERKFVAEVDDVYDLADELLEAKKAREEGRTSLVKGDHCKWCPAKVICPQHVTQAASVKEGLMAIKDVDDSTAQKRNKSIKRALSDYDAEGLRIAYLAAREAYAWSEQVIKFVKTEFEEGREIEGLKRVVSQNQRRFTDEDKAIKWLKKQGFTLRQLRKDPEFRTLTDLEKMVQAKGKEFPEDLIDKSPKGYSVVPLDDPKEAVVNDVQKARNALASIKH